VSYTYTPEDRVQTMAVGSGPTQTYAYYPDGSLNTIQWSVVGGNFKYTYTPTGQYQEITLANGQKRSYSYDDQGRLTQLSNALGATNLASFSYGYDHDWTSGSDTMLGQRTSMTANVPAQGLTAAESRYTYDPLYQLVKAQYPAGAVFGGETHEWTYDALGNRISSKVNGAGPSYSYLKNGLNTQNGQRLSSDGLNAYTYDPNGSQLTRTGPGGNYGFGYDFDNRMTSISGSETATYSYDYQGRRISKTEVGVTTTYLYDGLNPIAEIVGGAPKYVLNGPSIDEPLAVSASGTISYLNADGLGSVIATNNPAGTISHSLSFDAWGVPKNETGTRAHGFTYTGREAGVAGMHFYRARFLQASLGSFTQEDPPRVFLGYSQYRYVHGDPASWKDPTGDIPLLVVMAAAGALDIGLQLILNDGRWECINWSQVGASALLGGAGKILSGVRSLRAFGRFTARFLSDSRRASTISRGYSKGIGGAMKKGVDLDHWFLEHSAAVSRGGTVPDYIVNGGWNLLYIPSKLNRLMGAYSLSTNSMKYGSYVLTRNTIRIGVPSAASAAAYEGYELGSRALETKCGCE
jgi:RHS repeat-associated protein